MLGAIRLLLSRRSLLLVVVLTLIGDAAAARTAAAGNNTRAIHRPLPTTNAVVNIAVVWWEYSGNWASIPSANCEQRWVHLLSEGLRERISRTLSPRIGHGLRFLGGCAFSQFPLELMRIARLANPRLPMYLITERKLLERNPFYAASLSRMRFRVRLRERIRARPNSRALRYEADHENATLHPPQNHPSVMLSRFCEIADVAADEGLARLLILDADAGVFGDVGHAFARFPEEVVAPCAACSQDALWSVAALQAYCDGLVGFWRQPPATIARLFRKHHVDSTFNDMDFLAMFVAKRSATSRLLSEKRPSASNRVPSAWLPALTLLHTPGEAKDAGTQSAKASQEAACQRALARLSFANATARGAPSAIAAPTLGDGRATPVPMIHFQGPCKEAVHQLYSEHYAAAFARSKWALTADETRRHQSWWNAWLPSYDWRR